MQQEESTHSPWLWRYHKHPLDLALVAPQHVCNCSADEELCLAPYDFTGSCTVEREHCFNVPTQRHARA
jgi:hypothetical protein